MSDTRLICGDCLSVLPTIEAGSVDCFISDPPYPEIDRPYGRLTEAQWHELMRGVVAETRRVLKPSGSAVFILQPNSERVGRMRPWLWEFMAWTAREWNQVQDAWWWNFGAIPVAGAGDKGLMRPSLKACVWLGSPDCYRNQDDVLWKESEGAKAARIGERFDNSEGPSGWRPGSKPRHVNGLTMRMAAERRGGVTPFNVLPIAKDSSLTGHGAGTPYALADWWVRYICPPGGVVCDPFAGVGTIPLAALMRGRRVVAIERDPSYFATMTHRIERPHARMPRPGRDDAPFTLAGLEAS
jgi:DNA modification methylase